MTTNLMPVIQSGISLFIDKFKGKDEKVVTDADIDEAIEDAAE